jgi:hypothetical protein
MADRLSRWHLMIGIWEINNYCSYENQKAVIYGDAAHLLNKNERTVRAEMYYHAKRGRLEIVKIPRPVAASGVFPIFATLRRDGIAARQKGRRRSGFILSRKMIDVLSKCMYTDGNGEIQFKIPVATMTQAEVLTIVQRMRKKRRTYV